MGVSSAEGGGPRGVAVGGEDGLGLLQALADELLALVELVQLGRQLRVLLQVDLRRRLEGREPRVQPVDVLPRQPDVHLQAPELRMQEVGRQ